MPFRVTRPGDRRKAWGQAHTGPGMRFVSEDDAIEDPDNRGFWTTLSLWNKWRDQMYRDDRDAELQYMDQLWRGQVHGRGAVDWRRAAVTHGEAPLQLEVPLPSPHHVVDH